MSLPSTVIFFKDKEVVKKEFINCGWICNQKTITSAIKRTINMSKEEFDWDYAQAYGIIIKKEELLK